jgi:hypothetical protein
MRSKITVTGVRAGVAALAMLGAIAVGGAAGAAPAHEGVAVQATCADIQQQIENLEVRERALQDRLRHAAAWEKPAIVRMITAVQLRIGALMAELETCSG